MTDKDNSKDRPKDVFSSSAEGQRPATQHDAYGRDVSQWINVDGKLKPHP